MPVTGKGAPASQGRVSQALKCTSKGIRRQGMVLKHRNSLQKSLCPVICPYFCSSESWSGLNSAWGVPQYPGCPSVCGPEQSQARGEHLELRMVLGAAGISNSIDTNTNRLVLIALVCLMFMLHSTTNTNSNILLIVILRMVLGASLTLAQARSWPGGERPV